MYFRLLIFCLFFLLFGEIIYAQNSAPLYRSGQIIVKFKPGRIAPDVLSVFLNQHTGKQTLLFDNQQQPQFKLEKLIKPTPSLFGGLTLGNRYSTLTDKMKILAALSQFDTLYTLRFPSQITVNVVLDMLATSDVIEFAQPNYLYFKSTKPVATPNDPCFSAQYRPDLLGLSFAQAWDFSSTQFTPLVAVIDTGIQYTHADLVDSLWNDGAGHYGYNAYAAVYGGNVNDPLDLDGHGTHVSGIIAAGFNNAIGTPGVATNAKIMALKYSDDGLSDTSIVLNALSYAIQHGAQIVNMSFGGMSIDPAFHAGCDNAAAAGLLLVAAAGNDGVEPIQYPAAYPSVMAVGALNLSLTSYAKNVDWGFGYGSNFGPEMSVVAPGTAIFSTMSDVYDSVYGTPLSLAGGRYNYLTGTSQATPMVVGIAALIKQTYPSYTASQIRSIIENSADDLGLPGHDDYYGYGRINPLKAMILADNIPPSINLSSRSVYAPYSVLTITANLMDNISPLTTENLNAVIFFKSSTGNTYSQVSMNRCFGFDDPQFAGILPSYNIDSTLNYYIQAMDKNNNRVTSNVRTIYTADHFPPELTLLSTANLAPGRMVSFQVIDDSLLAEILISINGSVSGECVATYSYTSGSISGNSSIFHFKLPDDFPPGHYRLYAEASDILGNTTQMLDLGPFAVISDFRFVGPTNNIVDPVVAPNPLHPRNSDLIVGFRLTRAGMVRAVFFDLNGNIVHKEDNIPMTDAEDLYYQVKWLGCDIRNDNIKNGVYFVLIEAVWNQQKISRRLKFAVLN